MKLFCQNKVDINYVKNKVNKQGICGYCIYSIINVSKQNTITILGCKKALRTPKECSQSFHAPCKSWKFYLEYKKL